MKKLETDMTITGYVVAGIISFSALVLWSSANFSRYHPAVGGQGYNGAGFADGYARLQISKNSETGLVKKIEKEKQ